MPGDRCARSPGAEKNGAGIVTTSTPETPSIPRTMGYGLLRALPGDRALLTPSLIDCSTSLTPTAEASGPHDLAVRKGKRSSVAALRPSHPFPRS